MPAYQLAPSLEMSTGHFLNGQRTVSPLTKIHLLDEFWSFERPYDSKLQPELRVFSFPECSSMAGSDIIFLFRPLLI